MDEQTWDTLSGKPIDLQQLLRWGLQHSTANEDRTQASSEATKHEPVDPKWLEIIMGKPDIIRMKECVDNIKSDSVQDKDRYFDELELLVEDIDNAKDFVKSGLFDELFALADSAATKDSQLLANILWIMATIVQNNAYAKKAFLEKKLMKRILQFCDSESYQEVAVIKAVYFLSSFIKCNPVALQEFINLSGYNIILKLLVSTRSTPKLLSKIIYFLIQNIKDNGNICRLLLASYDNLIAVLVQLEQKNKDDPNLTMLVSEFMDVVRAIDPGNAQLASQSQ